MNIKQKPLITLFWLLAVVVLATACGAIDVGIEPAAQPTVEIPVAAATAVPTATTEPTTEPTPEQVLAVDDGLGGVTAVAWYGSVHSTAAGAQYDDYLALWPESLGQIGLAGATPDVESQIVALRDKEMPGQYAHFWGTLHCDVPDVGNCQLLVERLRPDGPGDFFDPDPVEGWEGTLTSLAREEPGSGGDDAFTLTGNWPIEYGIGSQDANIQAQDGRCA
ncbi:MAG: hypothetical protein P8183_22975 [Anaerolineae bacterium]